MKIKRLFILFICSSFSFSCSHDSNLPIVDEDMLNSKVELRAKPELTRLIHEEESGGGSASSSYKRQYQLLYDSSKNNIVDISAWYTSISHPGNSVPLGSFRWTSRPIVGKSTHSVHVSYDDPFSFLNIEMEYEFNPILGILVPKKKITEMGKDF